MESGSQTSLWTKVKAFFALPSFEDDETARIAALLNTILLGGVALILILVPLGLLLPGTYVQTVIALLVLGVLLFVLWLVMRQGYVRQASIALVGLILILGAVNIYFVGTVRAAMAAILILSIMVARLLINNRALVIVTVLCALILLGLYMAETAGMLPPTTTGARGLSTWLTWVGIFTMAAVLLGLAGSGIEHALDSARRSAAELGEQSAQLQALVNQRTDELIRREAYLGATTAIAGEAASVERDPQGLLDRVVGVISERFGFYHVGVFMVDPGKVWAELRASSSEGGARMRAQGHRLRLGEGMVGDVAQSGRYRLAQDVRRDAAFRENSDLPETHAEIALPLRVRGEVIGVLDVQSTESNVFSDEDVTVLQALADQIAVAVNSARLFSQVEERVEAERRVYGELAREAWQTLLKTRSDLAFASDVGGVSPFAVWEPQMQRAVRTGQVVGGDMANALALPIRVRDQVIGVIDGRKPDGTAWSEDEIGLLQALTDQLSAALEGAQLYDATQRRATREQLTREITDRMRAALGWDELMQTTLQEMARAVGASRAFVQWAESDER
ncbi:MAG: GAF domain-containing protein [Anaerolineae bacterium]|nr:GAF domain-containing protein [Anaerolineae bacterium]